MEKKAKTLILFLLSRIFKLLMWQRWLLKPHRGRSPLPPVSQGAYGGREWFGKDVGAVFTRE